jgi:hypothetical protein
MTPHDMLAGRQAEIHAARDRKLEEARQRGSCVANSLHEIRGYNDCDGRKSPAQRKEDDQSEMLTKLQYAPASVRVLLIGQENGDRCGDTIMAKARAYGVQMDGVPKPCACI